MKKFQLTQRQAFGFWVNYDTFTSSDESLDTDYQIVTDSDTLLVMGATK